jgi:HK97 family phage major capsid protein
MLHVKRALMEGAALPFEFKEDNSDAVMAEIKKAVGDLGKGFEEFKSANDQRIKEVEKKGSADVVLGTKIKKIGDDLDKLVEAKTALEKKLDAEKKEREELELRLSRPGANGKDADVAVKELKSFNDTLAAFNAEKSRKFTPLDEKGMADYRSNFTKFLRSGDKGIDIDTKTMSVGSDPDGGYFVTPDMTGRIATKQFETSPMREVASSQTIGTDALEGIEDTDQAGAGYADEHATSGDTTTPQFGKWRIPVFWIDTEPKVTQQLLDDANVNVENMLADKIADKFSRFENNEFVTGSAGKIRGFLSYTNTSDSGSGVTWGQIGYVASGAAGAFATTNPVDKFFDLVGRLKNAYLNNARWTMKRLTITSVRQFKDGNGNYIWQPSLTAGQPEVLLGYPITRMEDMTTVAANSYSIAFGDFRAAYQIVDRVGIRVLRDPFTAKPYVKFYTTKRTGGGVVNFEAIKLMKFATS